MKKSKEVSQNIPGLTPEAQTILKRAAELMALTNSVGDDVLETLRANGVTENLLLQILETIQGTKKDS